MMKTPFKPLAVLLGLLLSTHSMRVIPETLEEMRLELPPPPSTTMTQIHARAVQVLTASSQLEGLLTSSVTVDEV